MLNTTDVSHSWINTSRQFHTAGLCGNICKLFLSHIIKLLCFTWFSTATLGSTKMERSDESFLTIFQTVLGFMVRESWSTSPQGMTAAVKYSAVNGQPYCLKAKGVLDQSHTGSVWYSEVLYIPLGTVVVWFGFLETNCKYLQIDSKSTDSMETLRGQSQN